MVQRRTVELSERERTALEQERDHHAQAQVRERCAAILKIAAGQSPHEVAQTGLLKRRDPDTVYQWLNWYESEGLNGLLEHLHGGPRRGIP